MGDSGVYGYMRDLYAHVSLTSELCVWCGAGCVRALLPFMCKVVLLPSPITVGHSWQSRGLVCLAPVAAAALYLNSNYSTTTSSYQLFVSLVRSYWHMQSVCNNYAPRVPFLRMFLFLDTHAGRTGVWKFVNAPV
jgi:hypothetical protein